LKKENIAIKGYNAQRKMKKKIHTLQMLLYTLRFLISQSIY